MAVLSYGYWTRHFGSDPNILNKQLAVNGNSLTVVGVARPGFTGVQVGQIPDVFIPITMKAQMTPNWDGLADRNDHWVTMLGRLKPGMSAAKAQAGLAPLYSALMEGEATALKLSAKDQKEYVNRKIILGVGSHGRPILQQDAKQPLLVLMAMVGLVLLITCANLAGLLIARGEGRQREIALRLALGAGRVRLVRQLMTESLIAGDCGRRGGSGAGFVDAERDRQFDSGKRRRVGAHGAAGLSRADFCLRGFAGHRRAVWTGSCDSRHWHGFAERLEGSGSERIGWKSERAGAQVFDGVTNCVDRDVAGCGWPVRA